MTKPYIEINAKFCRLWREIEEYIHKKRRKYDNESIENDFARSCLATAAAIINRKSPRKPPSINRNRAVGKLWWSEVYNNWSDNTF